MEYYVMVLRMIPVGKKVLPKAWRRYAMRIACIQDCHAFSIIRDAVFPVQFLQDIRIANPAQPLPLPPDFSSNETAPLIKMTGHAVGFALLVSVFVYA